MIFSQLGKWIERLAIIHVFKTRKEQERIDKLIASPETGQLK